MYHSRLPTFAVGGIEQLIDRLATLTTGGHYNNPTSNVDHHHYNPTSNVDPHRTGLYTGVYTRRKKPLYTGQEIFWRHPSTGQIRQMNPNFQYGYLRRPYGYRYVCVYLEAFIYAPAHLCRQAH